MIARTGSGTKYRIDRPPATRFLISVDDTSTRRSNAGNPCAAASATPAR